MSAICSSLKIEIPYLNSFLSPCTCRTRFNVHTWGLAWGIGRRGEETKLVVELDSECDRLLGWLAPWFRKRMNIATLLILKNWRSYRVIRRVSLQQKHRASSMYLSNQPMRASSTRSCWVLSVATLLVLKNWCDYWAGRTVSLQQNWSALSTVPCMKIIRTWLLWPLE